MGHRAWLWSLQEPTRRFLGHVHPVTHFQNRISWLVGGEQTNGKRAQCRSVSSLNPAEKG